MVKNTLRASEAGLRKVYAAIRTKDLRQSSIQLWQQAHTSKSTLQRFWDRNRIDSYTFQSICAVAGVDWEEVAELETLQLISEREPELTPLIDDSNHHNQDWEQGVWVGRDEMIQKLIARLEENCRILSLVGITGIGKTALAKQLGLRVEKPEYYFIEFHGESRQFSLVAQEILGEGQNLPEMRALGSERGKPNQRDANKELMQALLLQLNNHPGIVVLDMLEEVLIPDGKGGHQFEDYLFQEFLEQVVKARTFASRIILTSQYSLPVLAEGRYNHRTQTEHLSGLTEAEGISLFTQWQIIPKLDKEKDYIKRIIAAYEGHPLALQTIAGEMREDPFNQDIRTYWNEYGHEIEAIEQMKTASEAQGREDKPRIDRYSPRLQDFVQERVKRTIERLYDSYPLACFLLCTGSVERRAVSRKHWLFLGSGTESPDESYHIAFTALERRFLLQKERTKSEVLYRLHSLIRRVALDYLHQMEWQF